MTKTRHVFDAANDRVLGSNDVGSEVAEFFILI